MNEQFWPGILVLALVYVLISFALNQKFGGRMKLKKIQREVQDYQKAVQEATKKNDSAALERLALREKEMAGYMGEMMVLPMKSLVFLLPLFFIFIGVNLFGFAFAGLVHIFFDPFTIVLPFGLHLNEIFALHILQPSVYGPRGFFIVCSVFIGIIVEAVYSRYESAQAAKNAPAAPSPVS